MIIIMFESTSTQIIVSKFHSVLYIGGVEDQGRNHVSFEFIVEVYAKCFYTFTPLIFKIMLQHGFQQNHFTDE